MSRLAPKFAVLCVLTATCVLPTLAQRLSEQELAAKETSIDPGLHLETLRIGATQVDKKSGYLRALYSPEGIAASGRSSDERAWSVLREIRTELGFSSKDQLRVEQVLRSPAGEHITLQQMVDGVPVLRRTIKINLNNDGNLSMLFSSFLPSAYHEKYRWVISSQEAANVIAQSISVGGFLEEPSKAIYAQPRPGAVYKAKVWRKDRLGEWEVLVDAATGEIVFLIEQSSHAQPGRISAESDPPMQHNKGTNFGGEVEGIGAVFLPDPLSSSGSLYGPPFVDSGDANIPELNDQRVTVSLPDITQGSDNFYRLEGPFVAIVGNSRYNPPEKLSANDFSFRRGEDDFEAVNAYYHLDRGLRYTQQLGFSAIQLRANPHAFSTDNSIYLPNQHAIEFGDGGVDDAEDAGVLWHELGHAILETASAGLLASAEGQALHEGWSDYWTASFLRDLAESGQTVRQDWRSVFKWDSGDGQIWSGREVNRTGVYPDDTICDDPGDSNGDGCNIYQDGLYWATALMNIYDRVGKEVTDRLNLQSHYYLNAPVTFRDAAEALLQADNDLYAGVHIDILVDELLAFGFLEPQGPVIVHTPLRSSEQGGSTVDVWAEVFTITSVDVSSVSMHFGVGGDPVFSLPMTRVRGDSFYVAFELPQLGTVNYYLEATDAEGAKSRFPIGAPSELLSFVVGPDGNAPSIEHEPISVSPTIRWPATVVAEVEDDISVDSVWVEYLIRNESGSEITNGRFDLLYSEERYERDFPIARDAIPDGYSLEYVIKAQDGSASKNQSGIAPTTLVAKNQGQLEYFSMEGPGVIQPSGIWERGAPIHGLKVAHSGASVWGTLLAESYPQVSTLSQLELPVYDLSELPTAYLEFWYWHDFEAPTGLTPEKKNNTPVPDGANVKISSNGGLSWAVAVPQQGYNAFIDNRLSNPLAGEPAFGGYSFGWRKAIVQLPTVSRASIRFDVGTDTGNDQPALGYFGFFVDDVRIVTSPVIDTTPPEIVDAPQQQRIVRVVDPLDDITIVATDDDGVASVLLEVESTGNLVASEVRAGMNAGSTDRFDATLSLVRTPQIGDIISYRFVLTDFSGNETVFPSRSDPALTIEYRSLQTDNVLAGATQTGSWQRNSENIWTASPSPSVNAVQSSSLILEPYVVSSNGTEVTFMLDDERLLGPQSFANVKISNDDGNTWTVLQPHTPYDGVVRLPSNSMEGEPAWSDSAVDRSLTSFDLSNYIGQTIRLRLDYASGNSSGSEYWRVYDISAQTSTSDPIIRFDRDLELHANFPDPASVLTTVSYSLPEVAFANVSIYDVTGRRVDILVGEEQAPGSHTLQVDTSNLASGLYLIVLEANGDVRTERMVIIK